MGTTEGNIGGIEKHRRRFRVTWQVGGERFRRSFESAGEAKEFLLELSRGAHEDAPGRRKGVLTIAEVVDNWYRGHRRNLSSGTRRDYEGRIRRDVGRIGGLLAEDLARNPRDLRAFYGSLTPTSARRLHAILRQAFQDALAHGEISRNPCDVVKARRPRPSERPIPSPEEVEKMILAAEEEDPLWGLFVNVSATIGTRRGETCALRWEDVDFDAGRLHVRRAVCKGIHGPTELKPPKTGRERSLFVGERFFDEIRPFRRGGGWIFSDGRRGPDAPWHPDWPGHRFSRLTRRLELPYTLHSLRHFVATQLLARGLPVTQVARFMGHKDPSVTLDLYANHVVDDVQRLMGETAASLFGRHG
ncbi:MAG: tyrosine-type recombinase/integrase [Actinomycetota bacterium]